MTERSEQLNISEVLILGGKNGLVGSFLTTELSKFRHVVTSTGSSDVDVRNKEILERTIKDFPGNTIVWAGAYTKVDEAETKIGKKLAYEINVEGTRNVAELSAKYKKHLVLISTDFIFSGTKVNPGPYLETANPPKSDFSLGVYASTKLKGEKVASEIMPSNSLAIVRIAYPFGGSKPNDFLSKTVNLIKRGLPLFDDMVVTPTYLPDLSRVLNAIINEKRVGIFHVASTPITPFEFGCYLKEKLGMKEEVKRGNIKNFLKTEGIAKRPINGGLDGTKTSKILNIRFTWWQDAVNQVIRQSKDLI